MKNKIDTPYEMIIHTVPGHGRPKRERLAALPDLCKMDIADYVSYIQVYSPEPIAFQMQRREDAPYDKGLPYETLFFPSAEIISFDALTAIADDADEVEKYYGMVMRGAAYRYYLAGGPGEEDVTTESAHFILTRDQRLFAFDINCVLLQPAYRPSGTENAEIKWEKISLPRYEFGGYKTS